MRDARCRWLIRVVARPSYLAALNPGQHLNYESALYEIGQMWEHCLAARAMAKSATLPSSRSIPRTPAQVAVRGTFGAVFARWRTLTEEQRNIWCAVARTKWSRPRLGRGRLPGFNLFVKTNVPLANRGMAQVDLPLEHSRGSQPTVSSLLQTGRFDQPPVGPMLFLQANQFIDDLDDAPRKFAAGVSPPT